MEPLTIGHWINSSNDLKLGLYLICLAFVCNHSGHVLLPVLFCYQCWCFLPSFEGNGWRRWERCMTVLEKWRPQTRRKEKELWQETTRFMTASIGLSWWEGSYPNHRDKSPSYCSNLLMIEVAVSCLSGLGFFSNNLTLLPLSNLESIF